MESMGYTKRERMNLYGSLALPPSVLTSLVYFGVFNGNPVTDPWYVTAAKVGVSALPNIPLFFHEVSIGAALFTVSHIREHLKQSENNQSCSTAPPIEPGKQKSLSEILDVSE